MRVLRFFVLMLVTVTWIAGPVSARYSKMFTENEKRLKRAEELIGSYSSEREPESLREASIELENVDLRKVHDRSVRIKQREQCLDLWLRLVQTIETNLDPTFDPTDVRPLNVAPPPLKNGTKLWPGADPALIDDPKAREEYEKAIKENREKQEKALIQPQLQELDPQVMQKTAKFVRNNYPDEERAGAKATIEKTIENEARRSRLYKLIDDK